MAATNSGISYPPGWPRTGNKSVGLVKEGSTYSFSAFGITGGTITSGVWLLPKPTNEQNFYYIWGYLAATNNSTDYTGTLYSSEYDTTRAAATIEAEDFALFGATQNDPNTLMFDNPIQLAIGQGVRINQNSGTGNRWMVIYYTEQTTEGW